MPSTSPFSSALDEGTAFISDLVLLGALILGAFLVVRIFYRLLLLLRARQLVVENLANSSGSDDIGKSLTGLSQLTREQLARQLRAVRREVDENKVGGGAKSAHVMRSAPLEPDVGKELDGTLNTLLESLKGVAPDRVKWVVEFMKLAFPQRGVIVNGDLQRSEDSPSKLGITLSVSEIDDRRDRRYLTVWERSRGSSKAGSKETSKEASEETSKEIAGSTPAKEVSRETSKETSDETSTSSARAAANDLSAGDPSANDVTNEAHKEISKTISKGTSKETSNEASKKVNVSKNISKENSTDQRDMTRGYIGLLEPGCRWLACEISEREKLAEIPSIPLSQQAEHGGQDDLAVWERIQTVKIAALTGTIRNFYGALYATSALQFDRYSTDFFRLAIDRFEKAKDQFAHALKHVTELGQLPDEDPEKKSTITMLWRSYLPYENLANTYSLLRQTPEDGDDEDSNAIRLSNLEKQDRALCLYGKALRRINDLRRIEVLNQADIVRSLNLGNIKRRIEVSRATSKLLTGDEVHTQEAMAKVAEIVGQQGLADEKDPRILYSLACWYAVAHEVGAEVPDADHSARLCLAYSLGRDKERDLWNWAGMDKDLASIDHKFLECLKLELMRRRQRNPYFYDTSGVLFARRISEALESCESADTG
jgi:hypothetical protein